MKGFNRVASSLLSAPGAGRFVLAPLARRGYHRYRSSGQTPHNAYVAMRKLYAADPRAFERLVAETQAENEMLGLPADPPGLLRGRIDDAVRALEIDGLFVLPDLLAEDTGAELVDVAANADCTLIGDDVKGEPRRKFDPNLVVAPRYDVDERDLINAPSVQGLICDESVLAVAQRYLRAAPIQDLVAMWWSAPTTAPPSSMAAQKFHFDLDRLRFLKVFVYLTEVDERSGPHVFVRGSHTDLPRPFRRDRRHEDAAVDAAFGRSVATITGRRGTVFLADTRGLHKGLPVEHGHRLVFQMEYTSSLFGAPCATLHLDDVVPALAHAMNEYPSVFRRLTTARSRTQPRAND